MVMQIIATLSAIVTNRIVIAAFLAWLIAQLIKSILLYRKNGKFRSLWIIKSGGMPSSHSAALTSLTLGLLYSQGVTTLFIVSGVLSIAIMRLLIDIKNHNFKQVLVGMLIGAACSLIVL